MLEPARSYPNMKKPKVEDGDPVGLYLDRATLAELDAKAAALDRSRSWLVRLAIRKMLGHEDNEPDPAAQGERH